MPLTLTSAPDTLLLTLAAEGGSRWALLAEGFALAMVGLVIVFGALFAMGLVLLILRHWGGLDVAEDAESSISEGGTGAGEAAALGVAASAATPSATPSPTGPGKPPVTPDTPGALNGRTLAILAAAAYTVVGQPVRVQRVHRVTHPREGGDAWARRGRGEVQSSHNLAKRGRS